MRAVPISKRGKELFNKRIANNAEALVMKMDEDEARMFVTIATTEMLWHDIEKNQELVDAKVKDTIEKCIDAGREALHKEYVSKRLAGEDTSAELARIGAFDEISKAVKNQYWYGARFDENKVRRDAGGRFTHKPKQNVFGDKPIAMQSQARAAGVPSLGDINRNLGDRANSVSDRQKAHYQSDFAQLRDVVGRQKPGRDQITVTIRGEGGERTVPVTSLEDIEDSRFMRPDEEITSIDVAPERMTAGQASFNLIGALGGSAETAGRVGDTIGQISPENASAFERQWNASTDPNSSNAQLYNRIATGSRALAAVSPAGSQAQMAAAFGRYVGEMGPEAEKVLGPTARKTAYRYRGTEKKEPDRVLVRAMDQLSKPDQEALTRKYKTELAELDSRWRLKEAKRRYPKEHPSNQRKIASSISVPDNVKDVLRQQARDKVKAEEWSTNATTRLNARKEMADLLHRHVRRNQSDLYDLQLNSGHVPPSEGIIIDNQGEIVAQAIGYADDHYLPFNLKKLKKLKDGEYIRTRSVGGPTSEDIYTGLISSANAVTVASRSGIFMIEFQDDFKGSRRYNDKAKRMIDRYEKLLDAVQSKQVSRPVSIPSDIKREIKAEVESSAEYRFARTDAERRKMIAAKEKEYRENPYLTEKDEENIERAVQRYAMRNQDLSESDIGRYEQDLRNEVEAGKELVFQLNGRGYEDALRALQEQFPYYIKNVRRVPLKDKEQNTGAGTIDRGYVKPRHNRPAAAKAGYFDQSITGRGKVDASTVDYQNNRVSRGERPAPSEERQEAQQQRVADSPRQQSASPLGGAQQREQQMKNADVAVAAASVLDDMKSKNVLPKDHSLMSYDADKIANEIKRDGSEAAVLRHIESAMKQIRETPGVAQLDPAVETQFQDARAGGTFNKSNWKVFDESRAPSFPEPAYQRNAGDLSVSRELDKFSRTKGLTDSSRSINEMEPDELVNELKTLARLDREISLRETTGADRSDVIDRISRTSQIDEGVISYVYDNRDSLPKMAEDIQRVRRLKELSAGAASQQQQTIRGQGPEAGKRANPEAEARRKAEDFLANLESKGGAQAAGLSATLREELRNSQSMQDFMSNNREALEEAQRIYAGS